MLWHGCILLLLALTSAADAQVSNSKNNTLKVVSVLSTPFLFESSSADDSDQWNGYVVDVLDELAGLMGIKYQLTLSDKYGKLDPKTNRWVGMIGRVVDGDAHCAIGDLTITPDRLTVVDFPLPLLSFNLAVLTQKSPIPSTWNSTFFEPFSVEVWVITLIICLIYAFVLFLIGRISHKDWRYTPGNKRLKNELGLWNSFWFMASSLFLKTSHTTPRGVAVRILSICFYFFAFFMTILYVANLAAFQMTASSKGLKTDTVEGLIRDGAEFGVIKGGSTHQFLENSDDGLHQRIFGNIKESNAFESLMEASEALTKNPNLAIVVESTFSDYATARNCSLQAINLPGTSRFSGLAFNRASPWTKIFSLALIKLKNNGKLDNLYRKWWLQRRSGGGCEGTLTSPRNAFTASEISTYDVEDMFIGIGVAIIICIVIAILEFIIRSVLESRDKNETSISTMRLTLRSMGTCRDRSRLFYIREQKEVINVDDA